MQGEELIIHTRVPSREVEEELAGRHERLQIGGYFWSASGLPDHVKECNWAASNRRASVAGAAGVALLREALTREMSKGGLTSPVSPADVTLTNGAMAGLRLIWTSILEPGEEVLALAPDYFVEGSVSLANGVLIRVGGGGVGSKNAISNLIDRIGSATRAIYCSNPRNPSGECLSARDFGALNAALEANPDLVLVVDEAYEAMCHPGSIMHFALQAIGARHQLVVVRSFSKSFALPALRLGWVAAPGWVTERMIRAIEWDQLFGSAVVQTIGVAAVTGPRAWLQGRLTQLGTNRDLMVSRLSEVPGLQFQAPAGGPFLYVNFAAMRPCAKPISERLRARGIPTVGGDAFGDSITWARIPFSGPPSEVEQACDIIEELCLGAERRGSVPYRDAPSSTS